MNGRHYSATCEHITNLKKKKKKKKQKKKKNKKQKKKKKKKKKTCNDKEMAQSERNSESKNQGEKN